MRQADLVIMATHARTGVEHWLHGSVAEAVVHQSQVPVMLVPVSAVQSLDAEHPTIVVPLDGSVLSESVLPFACDFARTIGASMVLVGVVPRQGRLVAGQFGAVTIQDWEDHSHFEKSARTYLADIAERARADGVSSETVLRYGEVSNEIIATIADGAPAAIVMATHGRTGPARTMLGSVAGAVVRHAARPVLLVHPSRGGAVQAVGAQAAAAE
jgi:nucleotide-binding universal stress UspA family protein